MSELLYSWKFDSRKERGNLWYMIAISIAVGLIIWGFLSEQYGMSFVIIILSGLIFYVENNSEDIVKVNITSEGIKVENSFYPFGNLGSYGIIYEGENAIILRVYLKNKVSIGSIDINIDNTIVYDVKNILGNYLEEAEKSELTFFEKIIRLLKI